MVSKWVKLKKKTLKKNINEKKIQADSEQSASHYKNFAKSFEQIQIKLVCMYANTANTVKYSPACG